MSSAGVPQAQEILPKTFQNEVMGKIPGLRWHEWQSFRMKDAVATVAPFERLLRGFERVPLKAGESKAVSFTLKPMRDLKMLNRQNEWGAEPGRFEVMISDSSADEGIKLEGGLMLK